jgi:segregation and condensation protein B
MRLLPDPQRLSTAALETLAIVAYRQPATRAEIEAIRGVNADHALRILLARDLVSDVGRRDSVGRPVLFGTTLEFLRYFGLESIDAIPPMPQDLLRLYAERSEVADA